MFTGIIKKVGKIKKIVKKNNGRYFIIEAVGFLKDVKIGDSISCDGVCLTVIKKIKDEFTVELMPETLKLTKFKNAKAGDLVNLEKAMKLGERLDGHFVMGHIDGVGEVLKVRKVKKSKVIKIGMPLKLMRFIAKKGSIAVNGVSLTVVETGKDWFTVSLVSYTLENTNLSELKIGDLINTEADVISRYLEKLLKNN